MIIHKAMGESSLHTSLVLKICSWVKKEEELSRDKINILIDLPGTIPSNLPAIINNFRPDFYAKVLPNGRTYIGEAKTGKDLETSHSRRQIRSFLHHLSSYHEPVFVIAVPWDVANSAKSLIRKIKKEIKANKVFVKVLDIISV